MGMQIEKSFVVNAPFSAVWDFLTDPAKVASCLPGAAITEQIDDRSYAGTMTVKVGPVTAGYRGKMRFEKLDREAGEAEIVASGQETKGKGGADMRMKSRVVERAPNETEVTVTSDVNVVGVLAQFGRGMIQDVSDQLFQKFSTSMRRELETSAAAPAPVPTPVETAPAAPVVPMTPENVATPAVPEPAPVAPRPPAPSPPAPAPPKEEVLDVGALGAAAAGRAAGRTFRRPGFWIVVLVLAVVIYWFFLR
jgi:carbon monoxide dehydrogenase subunit G